MPQAPLVTGLFRDRAAAERAYQSLESRGYSRDDVNVLMSDEARKQHFGQDKVPTSLGNKALEGAGVGSVVGGTVGAVLGAIAAIGTTLALPGLGLVIAGPIAGAFAGAGAGGLTGSLVGAMIEMGMPKERAEVYEEGIKSGGIVLGVRPRTLDDAAYFESEWRNARGEHIYR